MTQNDTTKPWDRMPGEPMLWYRRFERFRLLGDDRSVVAVYREEIARKKGANARTLPNNNVPAAWTINSRKWEWRRRAEAWDEQELEREREEREKLIRDEREGRIQMLVASRRMLARELQEMVNDSSKIRSASLAQVTGALETIFRLQREEFGEARERLEISGPDGAPMRTESVGKLDVSQLSDDALREMLAAMAHQLDPTVG